MKKIMIVLLIIAAFLVFTSCSQGFTYVIATQTPTAIETEKISYRLYNGYCGKHINLDQLDSNVLPIREVVEVVNDNMPKQKNIEVGEKTYNCRYLASYQSKLQKNSFHRYIGDNNVKIDLYYDGTVRMFSKEYIFSLGDTSEKTVDELKTMVETELKERFPELIDFHKYDLFTYNEAVSSGDFKDYKSYTFTWSVSKNGYTTQESIRTYIGILGDIPTVYFIPGDPVINELDFEFSETQKQKLIQEILNYKLTTDLTEFMNYYEITEEEFVVYEGKACLFVVADARFKVKHEDAIQEYWHLPVELILPLDE